MTIISPLPYDLQNGQVADATQVDANFAEIVNDVNANAAHSGANADITSLLGLTTPIAPSEGGSSVYTGGTVTGTANSVVLAVPSPLGFSLTKGKIISWLATATNTGPTTLNANASGVTNVYKLSVTGPVALVGGEIVNGGIAVAQFDGTQYVLLTNATLSNVGTLTNLASGTTTDLGTIASRNVNITGTTTITAFGSSASTATPLFYLTFAGALTLTYNGTSLILPGGESIITAAGDTAVAAYLGSGNWKVLSYTTAAIPAFQPPVASFSALKVQSTTDTNTNITANALVVQDAAGKAIRLTSVSVSNNISTSGANGLDTGSVGAATWYFVYVIYNPTTLTAASLTSLSATAPTLPSGYTYFARVGAVITDGSNHLLRILQYGRRAQYVVGTNPALAPVISHGTVGTWSSTSPTLSSVSVAAFVPSTAAAIMVSMAQNYKGATGGAVLVAPNTAWGGTNNGPSGSAGQVWPGAMDTATPNAATSVLLILESTNIAWAGGNTGSAIACVGWEDNL